jgi:aminopeptidase
MDPRTRNLAKTLSTYCLAADNKDVISIGATPAAESLVVALYEELIRAGAFPVVNMLPESCNQALLEKGKSIHFEHPNPYSLAGVKTLTGTTRICSSTNTRALSSVRPERQAALAKANAPLRKYFSKLKWNVTLFPTQAYAQDADMSLGAFEDYVYGATFSDENNPVSAWRNLTRKQARLIRNLEGAETVRIVGADTDLTLSVKGRTFMNSDGRRNMPSGEVFTGPIETSAEGYISYDFPVCNGGREIDGIRLVFKKGRVVEAQASKNEAYLKAMLNMDPGARRLGELGIGTNFKIQRFIKNILFDEKIGGTVHLALGSSYPETGGKNKSTLHWDMIKDLRKGGELIVDGKVIQRDGKFLNRIF